MLNFKYVFYYNIKLFQNSNCKTSHVKQNNDTETKKSIWRRGFVHLLKKKKLSNLPFSGNNNNDTESPSRNRPNHNSTNSNANNLNTRNGHARGTLRATPPSTLDIQATTVDITWSTPKIVRNNVRKTSVIETGTVSPDYSSWTISSCKVAFYYSLLDSICQ